MVGRGALACAALLLVGLLGREVAAPATAQIQSTQAVPVFQAQVGPPPPFAAAPVAIAGAPVAGADSVIDLGRLGISGATGAAPPALPATGAIGTSNAYLSLSPDLIPVSTTVAVGIVGSGFTAAELVDIYANGALITTLTADGNGRVTLGLGTLAGTGDLTILATGRTSGKSAGSVGRLVTGPTVPGLATAPHAVNPTSGTFLARITGFPANTSVTYARNGVAGGTLMTDANGQGLINLTVNSVIGDSSAVYSFHTATTGQFAGVSMEERADAGTPPVGDQNTTRAFIDRAIFNSAVGGNLGLVGEGFQAGETVVVSGCLTGAGPPPPTRMGPCRPSSF